MTRYSLLLFPLIVSVLACSLGSEIPGSPPVPTDTPLPAASATPEVEPTPPPRPDLAGQSLGDVTYCLADGVELKMDVYFPADMNATAPAVVYVHGGGWRSGDKRSGAGSIEVSMLSATGFVIFSVNYRLAPEYHFPAMIQDVKCAVRSIRARAADYGIDPNRIGALGVSAGGHLVSLLGTADQSAGFDVGEYLEYSSRVQAVVDMCGPADLTLPFQYTQTEQARQVFTLEQLLPASPVTHITADDPPFLILQGDRDRVVPPEQSQVLYDRLIAGGVRAELVMVKNANHGFDPEGGEMSPTREGIALIIISFLTETLK